MRVLRTPDERFEGLPDYAFAPHYLNVAPELRMHYVDEGDASARPVLMLHGEPSWSFLYRKMIPPLAGAGFRAIAPDLIGFGKSDKPSAQQDYSYALHVQWVRTLIETLDLRDIVLVCQDWGSLIGLRLAAELGARFSAIVVANGFLPTADRPANRAFKLWRNFARWSPVFPVGRIVASGCVTPLSPDVRRAYDAPFPSRAYLAGARVFPALVPVDETNVAIDANRRAWAALSQWEKPFLALFGKNDPILGGADKPLIRHIPGAKDQPHERFWGGHFVQEDRGDYLAERLIAWLGSANGPASARG
jgi:haloalkane dehalogenase